MGFFTKIADIFTSTKRPEKGTPILSKEEVLNNILNINRETAPYKIYKCEKTNIDLIAEWKITDTEWHNIFCKSGIKKVFKIQMLLDESTNELRAVDREYSISWTAGVPSLSISIEAFKGQKQKISFGSAFYYTEDFAFGKALNYKFTTHEIKKPIQNTVTSCGWIYKGVVIKNL